MHGDDLFAMQPAGNQRAGIKWRVLQRLFDLCLTVVRLGRSSELPQRSWQYRSGVGRKTPGCAIGSDSQRQQPLFAPDRLAIVEDEGIPTCGVRPGPVPSEKCIFQRCRTPIRIEITLAAPTQSRLCEIDLDSCHRSDRTPAVHAVRVQGDGEGGRTTGTQAHRAAKPRRKGRGDFVDVHDQPVSVPTHGTTTYRQFPARPPHGLGAPLRHGPAPAAFSVDDRVEGAVRFGLGRPDSARPGVVGRKHAAKESDHREA